VFRYPISRRASIGIAGSSADPQTVASATRSSGRSTSTPGSSSSRTRQRRARGRITLAVAGLDALLERITAEGIEHEPIETYSNGVRHVNIPDPDGNAIAFAEPPDAAARRGASH
jgi:catechol 2,3-dioxygenase-like lactoylglutathione lyase family enzyme